MLKRKTGCARSEHSPTMTSALPSRLFVKKKQHGTVFDQSNPQSWTWSFFAAGLRLDATGAAVRRAVGDARPRHPPALLPVPVVDPFTQVDDIGAGRQGTRRDVGRHLGRTGGQQKNTRRNQHHSLPTPAPVRNIRPNRKTGVSFANPMRTGPPIRDTIRTSDIDMKRERCLPAAARPRDGLGGKDHNPSIRPPSKRLKDRSRHRRTPTPAHDNANFPHKCEKPLDRAANAWKRVATPTGRQFSNHFKWLEWLTARNRCKGNQQVTGSLANDLVAMRTSFANEEPLL